MIRSSLASIFKRAPSDVTHESTCSRQKREAGSTLLEALISALLCSLLLLAWADLMQSIQAACSTGIESNRIQEAARLTHRILWLSIHQAGQNRQGPYVDLSAAGILSISSDLNGPSGDPDQSLDQPFERQSFRIDPEFSPRMSGAAFDQAANLQWKSGAGNFQPFITHLIGIRHELNKGRSGIRSISTRLQMRGRFTGLKRGAVPQRSFVFDFPVEKNREQWFQYDAGQ